MVRTQRCPAQDSDINGIVDVRYTGGARMLLLVEIGRGAWTVKVPVLVSDLDLECKLWLKLRLAPMRRALVTRLQTLHTPPLSSSPQAVPNIGLATLWRESHACATVHKGCAVVSRRLRGIASAAAVRT